MCGISGVYNYSKGSSAPIDKGVIKRMCDMISHRGPDDSGVYVNGKVGLGNRRLSIIDLSKGHQPIFNENKTIVVVYNGEIYNFKDIKEDLLKKGHVFSTNTDTEVIIHAYEEYGIDCVKQFNGMFAFAVWDDNKKRIFLARDRLGIKPLFYSIQGQSLVFGSELKCILAYKGIDRKFNFKALDHYFSLGYIPAPHTIFDGIHKLPPGHIIVCNENGMVKRRYWDVKFQTKTNRADKELYEEFIELLRKSVKIRLISDVPLGAFLSGGVDSSLITALMGDVSESSPLTFSIGFDDAVYDESPYSDLVARKYKTTHHNYLVKADIENVLVQIVKAFDEPFADDGAIPCFHVCRETRNEVKVALSGLGGDELFGGYPRYAGFKLSMWLDNFPFIKSNLFRNLIKRIPEARNGGYTIDRAKRFTEGMPFPLDKRYLSYLYLLNATQRQAFYSPDVNAEIDYEKNFIEMAGHYRSVQTDDPLNRAFYLDHHTYLPDDILALTDRMSMWHSLEVRVPFLDHNLVEFAASLPANSKVRGLTLKYFMKKAVSEILPQAILKKRKQGFVGPLPLWLMRELKQYAIETLSESNLKRHNLFNQKAVDEILKQHFNFQRKNETIIWALLVFDKWHRMYMEK